MYHDILRPETVKGSSILDTSAGLPFWGRWSNRTSNVVRETGNVSKIRKGKELFLSEHQVYGKWYTENDDRQSGEDVLRTGLWRFLPTLMSYLTDLYPGYLTYSWVTIVSVYFGRVPETPGSVRWVLIEHGKRCSWSFRIPARGFMTSKRILR